eukprot:gene2057-biopygen1678
MALSYANRKRARSVNRTRAAEKPAVEVNRSQEAWRNIGDFLSLRLEQHKSYGASLSRSTGTVKTACFGTSGGAMINIEGTPRFWYEAPWDEITSFALADGEIQEELLDHIKKVEWNRTIRRDLFRNRIGTRNNWWRTERHL